MKSLKELIFSKIYDGSLSIELSSDLESDYRRYRIAKFVEKYPGPYIFDLKPRISWWKLSMGHYLD